MDNPSYNPFEKAAEPAIREYLLSVAETLSGLTELERDKAGNFLVDPVDFGEERGHAIYSDRLYVGIRLADGDVRGFTQAKDPKDWRPTVQMLLEVKVDDEDVYQCFDDGSHCQVGQALLAPCTDPSKLAERINMLPTPQWLFDNVGARLRQVDSPSLA